MNFAHRVHCVQVKVENAKDTTAIVLHLNLMKETPHLSEEERLLPCFELKICITGSCSGSGRNRKLNPELRLPLMIAKLSFSLCHSRDRKYARLPGSNDDTHAKALAANKQASD